ncbi:tRNA (guanosine(37)-N1)-methyltransferase TrmD [Candidatus Collierbacteria bacterium RIFOXYB1_FULL_49_13]|uniref:tRNA (guanine-N(1)-)-methyltransferase n=1 Tax=Candidatus Collierbacteria bacterium RIFOXYB1_FULL_49_13 TaxID=1817728 RepID=A0A1F5FHE6_9BACT|nr:MAG: tRNA (guanosine(37)-N1)-methyltransferase TrmD [Candidatus Collierbacteria bacterium RIFOXYB1_FULL_49_13]
MRIDILTIFPSMFEGVLNQSILKRAQEAGVITVAVHDLRDWTEDKHKSVDDSPFGGGAGMVMRVDVVDRAVNDLKNLTFIDTTPGSPPKLGGEGRSPRVVLLDTKGEMFKQKKAKELSKIDHLILIAPHYEGMDQRVHEHIADEVLCVGEYVLTGGEIPAMAVMDAVVRLLPGVLGNEESLTDESFSEQMEVEYPQYTRPAEYKGWKVPEILISGDHKKVNNWRREHAKKPRE